MKVWQHKPMRIASMGKFGGSPRATLARALRELQDKAFVELTKRGQFYGRMASECAVAISQVANWPDEAVMSAIGYKRTFSMLTDTSALRRKADIAGAVADVRL
ncbi:MAG: hypothetical protein P8Z76_19660 [Alphaproteobacteria bacterium]